ncbi:MAG: hypothetical protein ABIH37_01090 [archaeon]
MEINQTHEKIISAINEKGPCLPIQLSTRLNMSSLFVSAFLSELSKEKRIKVSNLKVGGSPLYFLEGQEEKLEDYYKYLHPKEAETFLLLKNKKVIKDSEQDPAIRVALRSIRDFAVGFKINDQIYWRYISVPESEARELLYPKKQEVTNKIKQSSEAPATKSNKLKDTKIKSEKNTNEFQNPLVINQEKAKKQKAKSEFVQNTINFIKTNNMEIIKEKDYKAKEYNCIIQINSQLGPIKFLTQAKDKKTISEADLKKLLSNAQSIPIPAFLLYTGEISKKAKEHLKTYSSVLKAKKITI